MRTAQVRSRTVTVGTYDAAMGERWDAVVVGAGICGLATAYELTRHGRRVLVLEADAVGAGRSAGAPVERLGREEIGARVPLLAGDHPYDTGIWDPLAGVMRVRAALGALA